MPHSPLVAFKKHFHHVSGTKADTCCRYETVDDIPLVFLRNRAQIDRKLTRLQHSLHHAGSYVTNKEVLDRACQELHTDNWTELAFDNDRPYETMQVINRLQELLHFLIAAYVGVR